VKTGYKPERRGCSVPHKQHKTMSTKETKKTNRTLVGPVRLSYAWIYKPRASLRDGNDQYSAVLLFPKTANKFCSDPKQSLAAARDGIKAAAEAKFPKGAKYGIPLLDGDKEEKYPGHWYMNAKGDFAPAVVNPQVQPVTESDGWASGDWAKVIVCFYGGEDPDTKAKNVGCGLRSIQFVKHDEHFGGGGTSGVEMFTPEGDAEEAEYDPFDES